MKQTQNSQILLLDETALLEAGANNPKDYIEVITKVFKVHGEGNYTQPLKTYVYWNEAQNRLNVMPAYVGGEFNILGIKTVTSVPDNPISRGLPRGHSILILYSPDNGRPLAILAGTKISAMRTAGVTAVAAKYLAKPDSSSLGLIGAGPIAAAHIYLLREIFLGLNRVHIFDTNSSRAERLSRYAQEQWNIEAIPVSSAKEAVTNLDIVVPATSATHSFIEGEWISSGTFFSNIGVVEPKTNVISKAHRVVVDDLEQCTQKKRPLTDAINSHLIDRENITELGEILIGKKLGRVKPDEIVFFNPIGMGMIDAACGIHFYQIAITKNLGKSIDLDCENYNEFGML